MEALRLRVEGGSRWGATADGWQALSAVWGGW